MTKDSPGAYSAPVALIGQSWTTWFISLQQKQPWEGRDQALQVVLTFIGIPINRVSEGDRGLVARAGEGTDIRGKYTMERGTSQLRQGEPQWGVMSYLGYNNFYFFNSLSFTFLFF